MGERYDDCNCGAGAPPEDGPGNVHGFGCPVNDRRRADLWSPSVTVHRRSDYEGAWNAAIRAALDCVDAARSRNLLYAKSRVLNAVSDALREVREAIAKAARG